MIFYSAILLPGCAWNMPRGSDRSLYSIAETLEVHRSDRGKNIQLRLNQKVLFNFAKDEKKPGRWELADYERRTLLLLSETPRLEDPGSWGVLFQARALGRGEVVFRFIPETTSPATPNRVLDSSFVSEMPGATATAPSLSTSNTVPQKPPDDRVPTSSPSDHAGTSETQTLSFEISISRS